MNKIENSENGVEFPRLILQFRDWSRNASLSHKHKIWRICSISWNVSTAVSAGFTAGLFSPGGEEGNQMELPLVSLLLCLHHLPPVRRLHPDASTLFFSPLLSCISPFCLPLPADRLWQSRHELYTDQPVAVADKGTSGWALAVLVFKYAFFFFLPNFKSGCILWGKKKKLHKKNNTKQRKREMTTRTNGGQATAAAASLANPSLDSHLVPFHLADLRSQHETPFHLPAVRLQNLPSAPPRKKSHANQTPPGTVGADEASFFIPPRFFCFFFFAKRLYLIAQR